MGELWLPTPSSSPTCPCRYMPHLSWTVTPHAWLPLHEDALFAHLDSGSHCKAALSSVSIPSSLYLSSDATTNKQQISNSQYRNTKTFKMGIGLEKTTHKERHKSIEEHMKKWSASLYTRETLMKGTMIPHSYPSKRLNFKRLKTMRISEDVEKLELSYFAQGNVKNYIHFGKGR